MPLRLRTSPRPIDRTFDVNVKKLLFTAHKALPLYSATEPAIRNFARSWALDLRGAGIRVNVLAPRRPRTDLAIEVVGEAGMAEMGAGTPLGRLGDPAETAAAAVFVDGGVAKL